MNRKLLSFLALHKFRIGFCRSTCGKVSLGYKYSRVERWIDRKSKLLSAGSGRFYSSNVSGENDSETDSDEEAFFYSAADNDKTSAAERRILYPDSDDPVLSNLINSSSVQEVFDIITENEGSFNEERVCQTVIVLWDIQKLYYKMQFGGFLDLNWSDSDMQTNEVLKVYVNRRNQHPTFKKLLELVEKTYPRMTYESLSCTFLFLSKMGFNIRQDKLLRDIMGSLESLMRDFDFPLTVVSRYSVALKMYRELWAYISLIRLLPHIIKKIDAGLITTVEDFHLITIVMKSCNHIMSKRVFGLYKALVEKLLSTGMLANAPPNTIIKVLSLLNSSQWVGSNTVLIRQLLHTLVGKEDSFNLNQAIYIQKLLQSTLEPRSLMDSLKKTCANFFKIFEDENHRIPASLLSTCISSVPVVEQPRFETHIKNYIFKEMLLNDNGAYSLLPQLKICRNETINTFWTNCYKSLLRQGPDSFEHSLLELCERYCNFTSSVSNSYRHYVFETNMVNLIKKELIENSSMPPRIFLSLSSFVLSFGLHWHSAEIPHFIYSKLMDSIYQYNLHDCLALSRALRTSVDIKKNLLSSSFLDQYVLLITALNSSLLKQVQENDSLSLNDINLVMRAFINIKGMRDDQLYSLILNRFSGIKEEEFTSRSVRNTVYNFIATSCFLPDVLEKMIKYVSNNHIHVNGDTMGKLLHACYIFDYKPKDEKFISIVADAVIRDLQYFNGLSLLQSALSLSYFQCLPMQLIQHIFSVQFLETLDEEIKYCYSRENYPSRVRYHLMQLNRVVCLDILESDVPWFHDKYCQQLIASEPTKLSHFHVDVLNKLVDILGGEQYIKKRTVAHYGYLIDYLIQLDDLNNPISQNGENNSGKRRIAVLLHKDEEMTGTDGQSCQGALVLKRKHLEILNYEVLIIKSHFWNSMFMAEEGAKVDYLQKALQLHKTDKIS